MPDQVGHDAAMMVAFYVIAQVHDLFASDIETYEFISASLGSCVILAFPPDFLQIVLSIVKISFLLKK